MPLVTDVAIVTANEVAQITHEGDLTNPDSGQATIANLLPQATNALMREVKQRGVDPALVSNQADMRQPASYWVAWSFYRSLPADADGAREKAESYRTAWLDALRSLVIETTAARDSTTLPPRGAPRTWNLEEQPNFNRPRANGAGRRVGPYYVTR